MPCSSPPRPARSCPPCLRPAAPSSCSPRHSVRRSGARWSECSGQHLPSPPRAPRPFCSPFSPAFSGCDRGSQPPAPGVDERHPSPISCSQRVGEDEPTRVEALEAHHDEKLGSTVNRCRNSAVHAATGRPAHDGGLTYPRTHVNATTAIHGKARIPTLALRSDGFTGMSFLTAVSATKATAAEDYLLNASFDTLVARSLYRPYPITHFRHIFEMYQYIACMLSQ